MSDSLGDVRSAREAAEDPKQDRKRTRRPVTATGIVEAVSQVARAITATDYNESTLAQARLKGLDPRRVTLRTADAYDLSSLSGTFDGALAVDWFAHVPKSRVATFLAGLHQRLMPGARVVFCDQLPNPESFTGVYDAEGNHLQERVLPDGSRYR